jgi:hypothetical protein
LISRAFLIAILIYMGAGATDLDREAQEIEAKYRHALVVRAKWDKWQQALFERATLLDIKREQRDKRAKAEKDAFAALARAFSELEAIK